MDKSNMFIFFYLFFFFNSLASSSSYPSNSTHRCPAIQSHALFMFKQNLLSTNDSLYDYSCQLLGSSYYPITMNWKMSSDCCNWHGVKCNHFTGDVIGLDLSCGMLRGTIHPNTTIFHLPHLQRLNLAFNDFTGSRIPHEIGRLSNSLTHLNVSSCSLTGQIPSEILLLSKLASLDLSFNLLDLLNQPHLFHSFLQNYTLLRDLSLSDVNISLVLPAYLNISSALKSLDLHETSLQGILPDNIFNLYYLEKLDLSGNFDLTGPLPKMNTSTNIPLKWLDLSAIDGLSGEIPDSIGHLKSLNYLDISGCNLSGEIPDSIGHLKFLSYLDLSGSSLSGEIPHSIGHLNSLNYLRLSDCSLSGVIPDSIGHLKYLNTLKLRSCGLMGHLPKSVANLEHLTHLDLSGNMLKGMLPSSLFTLPLLENLLLSDNMFSGSLPLELFTLRSLKIISLEINQFDGEINVLDQGHTLPTFQQLVNLTDLYLGYNNFRGDCELETLLSSLPNLEVLDLSFSGLSIMTNNVIRNVNPRFRYLGLGSCKLTVFPKILRVIKNLDSLDLSNNEIHGHIPDWVGEMKGFIFLNLSRNFITSLPKKIKWDQLEDLDLQSNLIQGPFPPSICNLNNLQSLDMSDNNFGGLIPQCFGNISSSIGMIAMRNNHFHGTIPNVFEHCYQLSWLILNGNQLEGEVPRSLSNCRWLRVLDLGNNRLTGAFPDWAAHLPQLQVLVLKSNKLNGRLENSSMAQHPFHSLKVLDLSHNEFTGHLPTEFFQNFDAMKNVVKKGSKPVYLSFGLKYYFIIVMVKGYQLPFPKILVDYTIVDLSKNRFDGEIPDVISSLKYLKVLNLSHNNLSDQIPLALGNLIEIESLDLSWNHLTGHIPQSLAEIKGLEVLDLSQNDLVGRIPEGTQFKTFSNTSFEGNPRLCGFPLLKHCEHLSDPQVEAGEDEESGLTWNVVMLGYGCGTLVGLTLGYLMLSTGRPKWFNAIANAGEQMIQRRQNMRRYIYIGK